MSNLSIDPTTGDLAIGVGSNMAMDLKTGKLELKVGAMAIDPTTGQMRPSINL